MPRFLPAIPGIPPPARDALATLRCEPRDETGRLEVRGLDAATADVAGLDRLVAWRGARSRLETTLDDANGTLARLALRVAGRLEPLGEDATGIRLSGVLVPFYGRDAARIRHTAEIARERPWEALTTLRGLLRARLEEPADLDLYEEATTRRDLSHLYREIDDALLAGEAAGRLAVEGFRREAAGIALRAGGPFWRRGPGRIVEIVLAALLGTVLREALRRRGRAGIGPRLTRPVAPVLATAVILLLEGTPVLPVDPLRGISLLFLPLTFALGWSTGTILALPGRLEGAPAAPAPTVSAPATPAPATPAPAAPAPAAPAPAAPPVAGDVPDGRDPDGRFPDGAEEAGTIPGAPPAAAPSAAPPLATPLPFFPRRGSRRRDL